MNTNTNFSQKVLSLIKSVPKGRVATYGQIALLAGNPRGARGVSWLLHSCSGSHNLPWHRIINSQGKISFPLSTSQYIRQRHLLEKDGVVFVGEKIDLMKYGWKGVWNLF